MADAQSIANSIAGLFSADEKTKAEGKKFKPAPSAPAESPVDPEKFKKAQAGFNKALGQ